MQVRWHPATARLHSWDPRAPGNPQPLRHSHAEVTRFYQTTSLRLSNAAELFTSCPHIPTCAYGLIRWRKLKALAKRSRASPLSGTSVACLSEVRMLDLKIVLFRLARYMFSVIEEPIPPFPSKPSRHKTLLSRSWPTRLRRICSTPRCALRSLPFSPGSFRLFLSEGSIAPIPSFG